MSRGKQLFAALIMVSLFIAGLSPALYAQTAQKSNILIVELQTGSEASASEEFIELANVSDEDVDVSNWRLEYYSASPKSFDAPSRVMPLSGILPAGKHYLLSSSSYLVGSANDSFSAGLASGGGHIFLVSASQESPANTLMQDAIGWGNASRPEGVASVTPAAGKSLTRKLDEQSKFIDTDNNFDDFHEQEPSPEGFVRPPVSDPEPESPEPTDPLDPAQPPANPAPETVEEDQTTASLPSWPIEITELLPNPASPQTDAKDEFIELYNPNDVEVELTGYRLQTGTTYSHSFEFNDQTIGPKAFKAFYITETGLVLANSSGKARLLDPNGQVINETMGYETAGDGLAWAWNGNGWEWSTSPTPNALNSITQKAAQVKASTAVSSSKKKTAAKKATSKPKASKVNSAKASKSTAANGSGAGADADLNARATTIHPGILATAAGLALSYGAYEYRRDIASGLHRLKARFSRSR